MDKTDEVLLKIYIGQNVHKYTYQIDGVEKQRNFGILEWDIKASKEISKLLDKKLIYKIQYPLGNNYYHLLNFFLTTEKGLKRAADLLKKRLEENKEKLMNDIKNIPKRALSFIIENADYDYGLVYIAEKPLIRLEKIGERKILLDSRLLILRDKFFTTLLKYGLCVKARTYTRDKGIWVLDPAYVISPEIRNFLLNYLGEPLTTTERKMLNIYSFLVSIKDYLNSSDLDNIRQRFYRLLKQYNLEENDVAAFIKRTFEEGITTEYRGLLYDGKPFEIKNYSHFKKYLENEVIKPITEHLLELRKDVDYEYLKYTPTINYAPLSEVREKIDAVDNNELAKFYFTIIDFERDLREFLKKKLGKGWLKRLKNDKKTSKIVKDWEEKRDKDLKIGTEPEKDLMNYADYKDYVDIIEANRNMFSDNPEELAEITVALNTIYKVGRNRLMHGRTIKKGYIWTTEIMINKLRNWMERKSKE